MGLALGLIFALLLICSGTVVAAISFIDPPGSSDSNLQSQRVAPTVDATLADPPDEAEVQLTPTAKVTTPTPEATTVVPDTAVTTEPEAEATTRPAPRTTAAPVTITPSRACDWHTAGSKASKVTSSSITCTKGAKTEQHDVVDIDRWCKTTGAHYEHDIGYWFCGGSTGQPLKDGQICDDSFPGSGWKWINTDTSDPAGSHFVCRRTVPRHTATLKVGRTLNSYCRSRDAGYDTSVRGTNGPRCKDLR